MIADATALAAFFLREPASKGIADILAKAPLVTLELALKEIYNTILKRYWKGKLKEPDISIINKAVNLSLKAKLIRTYPQKDILDRAFEVSLKTELSIYDAFYLALAEHLSEPLLTLNPSQLKVADKLSIEVYTPK